MSENTNSPFPQLMNKKEVAQYLGYTTRTIDRMIANRVIPFMAIPTGSGLSTRCMFDPNEIEKWIKNFRRAADPNIQNRTRNPRATVLELMLGK